MAYEESGVATEYDGREFHTSDRDRAGDVDRREDLSFIGGWRFVLGTYERVFGTATDFEHELGDLLQMNPLPRLWY